MGYPEEWKTRLRLPVIGAPMFIVSTPELVIAQCQAGIIGTFPSLNARPQSQLRDWIQQIKAGIKDEQNESVPFGVNLVAMASNQRLEADLAVCIEEKVPLIITSMKPPGHIAKAVHSYGGQHFHDVTTIHHAQKAIEAGVDGLILVSAGAGGHAGRLNPFAFVKEVRQFYQGSIILAGAITSGQDIRAAQCLGADMVYIGSRFISTKEANADQAYKDMLVSAGADDIIYTPHFTGVNASFMKASIQAAGLDPSNLTPPMLKKPQKWRLWLKHWQLRHLKKWKDIWSAGQGVGAINEIISVETYIQQLAQQYQNTSFKGE